MPKKLNQVVSILVFLTLLINGTSSVFAQEPTVGIDCVSDYTVQVSDSIGTIAQKHYGNTAAYQVIVDATNLAAQRDHKYNSIPDPNIVNVGQVLCLPSQEVAQSLLDERLAPAPAILPPAPAPIQNAAPQAIQFSHEAMVTQQPFQLSLSSPQNGIIRYTTNGSLPTPESQPYTGPIPVNQNLVIQAQLFDAAGNPLGNVQTKSYIIANYDPTISVVSIVTDWTHLDTLYANAAQRGQEWERPINLEYFAPGGQAQFNVRAGIRIHGNFSRLFSPKKSYRIYFREEYGGPARLEYPLFEDTPVTSFDTIVLRAGFQDTFVHRNIPERADRSGTARYINDQVVRNLHRDMGQLSAHGRWVLLYLNGEFWGLYNMTEYIDQDFFRAYSEPEAEWNAIVKESGWENGQWYSREEARVGGYDGWLENQNWIGSADFTKPESIGEWEWRVNKENIFSYMFLQAYVQHTDWPGANWVAYRRWDTGSDGNEHQWRLMVWDAEDSFGGGEDNRIDMNILERAYSPHDSITRIMEKAFIGSCYLKNDFVQRAKEYLGVENPNNRPANEVGQLSKERVRAEIIKQADIVRPFIPLETQRWAPDLPGLDIFNSNVEVSLRLADTREQVILEHLRILKDQTFTQCK